MLAGGIAAEMLLNREHCDPSTEMRPTASVWCGALKIRDRRPTFPGMSTAFPLTEKDRIQVGKPLPFSIFSADGKLLLAAGRVVESERLREMLTRNGRFRGLTGLGDADSGGGGGGLSRGKRDPREAVQEEAPPPGPPPTPLERMRKDYDANGDGQRVSISIARTEADKAHTVQLLGAHAQTVMVTAPVKPDGSLVPVQLGQTWLCRTFQMMSAFRFSTVAVKVAFDPFPHLCLKLQKDVEQRRVRNAPRAKVSVGGELHASDAMPCLVADLSATGARVAIDYPLALERGSTVRLAISIPLLASTRDLSLEATILNALGPSDVRYPEVSFYGIQFKAPTDLESLALQAFVNSELISESNSLWQMLSMASSPIGGSG